jgi:proliferating cell nuclear antigen
MLVKLENPSLLSKPIDLISEIVTEVKIKINDFGMSITALDPANVAMVGFRIPKTAFSQFETGPETLGVNLDSLKKILRRCNNGSSLIIEKIENILNFSIQDKIKRNFTLSLIDIESQDKELPNLDFSGKIEINSSDFVDSIEDCAIVSDACSFIIKDGKFMIESKGLNSSRAEFSSDETKIDGENCKSRYSLEYLQKFSKGCKFSEKTMLSFADDHPLRMDIKTEHMSLSFILAPRVETED